MKTLHYTGKGFEYLWKNLFQIYLICGVTSREHNLFFCIYLNRDDAKFTIFSLHYKNDLIE